MLYLSSDQFTGAGTVWNVSRGGWHIDSESPLPCGTVMKLFVVLPKIEHGLVIEEATVCWSRGHEMGLAIQTINEPEAARLQDFITACV